MLQNNVRTVAGHLGHQPHTLLDTLLVQNIVCMVAGHLCDQPLTIWHGDRQEQVRGAQQAAD